MDSPTNNPDDESPMEKLQKDGTTSHHEGEIALKPRFGFWTLLGYQMMVMASWSNYLVTIGVSVDVGGPVGFLYGTIVVGFFQLLTVLAMAELASAWPHPGGPLFWITKLVPGRIGPTVSFFMGWINVLAYASPLASAGFSSTQVLAALITNVYGYEWSSWQMCLMYWGFAIAFVPVSLRPAFMPMWSMAALICLLGTLVVTIGLWVSHIQPQTTSFVFTKFVNNTGWSNNGFVFVLSLVQTTYAMSGLEAATHMSFETKNPKRTVPLVLVSSVVISTILCFGFAILLLFALGPLDSLVNSSLGAIYIQLYVNSAGRAGGLAVATIIMVVLNQFCGTQLIAAGSRVVWALARMGWVPYSSVFERVNHETGAPVNATFLTLGLSLLFGLLYIASETAWNAVASCVVGAFQITYIAPLIVLMIQGRSALPTRYFNLDKVPGLGYIIDILAILWGICIFLVSLFPVYMPVTASTMNYCIVVFGFCAVVLIPYWMLSAKYKVGSEGTGGDVANMLH
ncbi:amino acid/polyamine transporter I [Ilyonectria destructans]|nr:amino acid/polyamine transporter I [Ilyonectria destructans]